MNSYSNIFFYLNRKILPCFNRKKIVDSYFRNSWKYVTNMLLDFTWRICQWDLQWTLLSLSSVPSQLRLTQNYQRYSIVKDSSADLGVNSKIVQIRPTVKAVSTKISKKIFCIFVNIFIFLRENKEAPFFLF